jgi:hypothetical protein
MKPVFISGELEILRQYREDFAWIKAKASDHIHVPSNARHAFRNISDAPAVVLIITIKKRRQFFQEIGRSQTIVPLPVTPERFAVISARHDDRGITLEFEEIK